VSDSARSPFAGCAILIAAVLMLVFLIGFSIWVPFRQAAEIEKFTQAEPEPVEQLSVGENEAAARELAERLEAFRSDLSGEGEEARIELDRRDLNLAIAMFPALEELRGTFWVREITDEALVIDICYRLNGRPRLAKDGEEGPITADPLYLIGSVRGRPVVSSRELVLQVDDLEVPGKEVAEGFMGHFSTLRIFEGSLEDPVVGPAMGKLTRADLEDGKLILARVPGESPPDVISEEEFQASGGKVAMFLGGAAVLFLLHAGTVLYLGYRAQLRKNRAEEQTTPPREDA